MIKLCEVIKDGYWCTLPKGHTSLHCDEVERVRFDESWPHASGWHYPPRDSTGHAIIHCTDRCHPLGSREVNPRLNFEGKRL